MIYFKLIAFQKQRDTKRQKFNVEVMEPGFNFQNYLDICLPISAILFGDFINQVLSLMKPNCLYRIKLGVYQDKSNNLFLPKRIVHRHKHASVKYFTRSSCDVPCHTFKYIFSKQFKKSIFLKCYCFCLSESNVYLLKSKIFSNWKCLTGTNRF